LVIPLRQELKRFRSALRGFFVALVGQDLRQFALAVECRCAQVLDLE
jgi:hypothetical protein